MGTMKTVLASLGIAGLLIGNTAAAASTRSYQSLPTADFSADSLSRSSEPLTDASFLGEDMDTEGEGTLLLILAAVLVGAGIFLLVDNDDDDVDSPG
jgi:hypothetical protein